MKRLLLCLTLSLGLFSAMLSAQNVPEGEMLRLNISLLDAIERYERLSPVQDGVAAVEYMDLFRDRKIMVYNDIPGDFSGTSLPLADYVAKLRSMNNVVVELRNVEKSKPFVSAGSLCVLVSFDKCISGYDSRGVFLSTEDMYGAPHHIELMFAYDDFEGKCQIESLSGSLSEEVPGNMGRPLVYCADKNYGNLRFRKQDVPARKGFYSQEECQVPSFNVLGQAFLPETAADEDWYYMQDIPSEWDPDVFIRTSVSKDGFMTVKADKNYFRARIYNSVAPAGAYAVEGDIDRSYSVSDELGVELRFMFNCGRKFNVGAYGALGISGSYLDVAVKDFGYTYTLNKTDYSYAFDVLGQRFLTVDAVLSGGLAFEYSLSRRWAADVKLGGKAYYNLYAKSGDIYCSYDFKAGTDVANSITGHFRRSNIINTVEYTPDVWPCPLSATASLGFNYSISKAAQFTFGLTYEHGLNYYYQSNCTSYKEYDCPVKYSTLYGIDMVYWALEDTFHVKRRAVWLDLGFIFKF